MSSRKPVYVISIILLAGLLSTPQILAGLSLAYLVITEFRSSGMFIVPEVGLASETTFKQAAFWKDKLVFLESTSGFDSSQLGMQVLGIDLETGKAEPIISISSESSYQLRVFGDRMWLVNGSTLEVIDGVARESEIPPNLDFKRSLVGSSSESSTFMWEGDPAEFSPIENGVTVNRFAKGDWKPAGYLPLPRPRRELKIPWSKTAVRIPPRLQVHNFADEIHLFVYVDGQVFYRKGLAFDPDPILSIDPQTEGDNREAVSERPVSAREPENVDFDLEGWTRVREYQEPLIEIDSSRTPTMQEWHEHIFGMTISGQPAAMIVDNVESNRSTGRLYRFDGRTWSELASEPFPFASRHFRLHPSSDGLRSYLVVTTATGSQNYVYAIDESGFRKTRGASEVLNGTFEILIGYAVLFAILVGFGILLGSAVGLLMRRYTKSGYEFGRQRLNLSSLIWRGIARLIDLGLIGASIPAVIWLQAHDLDWVSYFEARSLRVEHPSIQAVNHVFAAAFIWLVLVVLALIVVQGRWGITPGKWLCRIRLVRTTLRPSGFARSLAREVVFFVDCCNGFCWTPGIVSIAFTDRRQRLGDLVADTIVVDSSVPKPSENSIESL